MQLQLDKSSFVDRDFVNWILLKLPYRVLSNITNKKFITAKRILKEAKIDIDPRRIIMSGCRCLQVIELKDVFIVDIRRKVMFAGTGKTVKQMCSMIEYGNLTVPGTHVFTEAFQEIKMSINDLYSDYITELI